MPLFRKNMTKISIYRIDKLAYSNFSCGTSPSDARFASSSTNFEHNHKSVRTGRYNISYEEK